MANTDVINLIVQTTADYFTYMLPIIGVLAGISFMATFLFSVTMGLGRRTFRA
jgi:hypothetical protein